MQWNAKLRDMSNKDFATILFYKYVTLDDVKSLREEMYEFCVEHNLKGRILIGLEGINGTLGGRIDDINKYIKYMSAKAEFSDINYKMDITKTIPFPKLRIRARNEIVTLCPDVFIDMKKDPAPYIEPEQLNELSKESEIIFFDMRNNYESKIGKLKNAITPNINNFRDLPKIINDYKDLKNKTVVTYCTGGIRCEKASAYLRVKGFKKVYQLHGGIIEYAKKFPNSLFIGKCYVFDNRVSVAFKEDYEKLASCYNCQSSASEYVNCLNKQCNKRLIVCDSCIDSSRYCSDSCQAIIELQEKSKF